MKTDRYLINRTLDTTELLKLKSDENIGIKSSLILEVDDIELEKFIDKESKTGRKVLLLLKPWRRRNTRPRLRQRPKSRTQIELERIVELWKDKQILEREDIKDE